MRNIALLTSVAACLVGCANQQKPVMYWDEGKKGQDRCAPREQILRTCPRPH